MAESPTTDRAAAAARILNNPDAYKVCEGCGSIVASAATLCPNCHSFRFETSADQVIDQARLLGSRAQTSVTAEDLC
jgi:hypothetical protein